MPKPLLVVFCLLSTVWLAPIPGGAEPSAPNDRDLDCLITPTPSDIVVHGAMVDRGEIFDHQAVIAIDFENRYPQPGNVTVNVTLFSQQGFHSFAVPAISFAAQTRAPLTLPVAQLRLPTVPLDFSGHLILNLTATYSDAHIARLPQPICLYFHPQEGGWRIYDAPTADSDFDGGALSETAKALRTRTAGLAPVGPAWVRSGVDRLHKEDGAGKPDPEAPAADATVALQSGSLQLCIEQISTYTDSGVGEDYWRNSTPTPRSARGGYVEIRRAGNLLYAGFLGDGLGAGDPGLACTPPLAGVASSQPHDITVESRGEVQANTVEVTTDGVGLIRSYTTTVMASSGVTTVMIDPASAHDEFNIFMAGAYATWRHAGGLQSQTYRYRINSAGGSRYDRFQDTVYIHPNHHFKKFVIVHEAGHAMGDFGTGNNNFKLVGTNCTGFSDLGCPAASGGHSMVSKERARCALGEGFAHFFAADVYNDHGETDCWFHYYKNEFGNDASPIVDCEAGNGDFVLRAMELRCARPWGGFGTELDWMRALWDVHTDGGSPPGFTAMIQWLDGADPWGDATAFDELDREADQVGGDLDVNWDAAAPDNGIAWPSTTIFGDSFESGDLSAWN